MILAFVLTFAALGGLYVLTQKTPIDGLYPPLGPLQRSYRVSSPFGARIDPITKLPAGHNGIDFATPPNTPIYAVADGEIYKTDVVGDDSYEGNGNAVFLRAAGIRWGYLHLTHALVTKGQRVTRGQLLGHTGNTGRSTGPHLHFMATDDATSLPVDPSTLFAPGVLS